MASPALIIYIMLRHVCKYNNMVTNAFIVRTAQKVMLKMGGGHSEAVYQCALVSLLMAAGIPCMTEVSIPYFLDGICVGMGRADILLKSHLIELKANQKTVQNVDNAKVQLAKYLRAMHQQGATPRTGMLILFNTPCEGPLHKRLSVIHVSHQFALMEKNISSRNGIMSKAQITSSSSSKETQGKNKRENKRRNCDYRNRPYSPKK